MLTKPKNLADSNYLQYMHNSGSGIDNLYRYAEDRRQNRYKEWKSVGVEKYLSSIAEEISIRTRITQQEIFLIGELLCEVRETLKPIEGKNFKGWIKENCDFGYDTALNFCRVFTVCLGNVRDIEKIQISTLYKVSQTSFPKDLREHLFDTGAIKNMSIAQVKELYDEYKKNGFKEIPEKAAQFTNELVLGEQVANARSKAIEAKYKLRYIQKTLTREDKDVPFEMQKGASVVGDKIRHVIHSAFSDCIETLTDVLKNTEAKNLPELETKIAKLEHIWGDYHKKGNAKDAKDTNVIDVTPIYDEESVSADKKKKTLPQKQDLSENLKK